MIRVAALAAAVASLAAVTPRVEVAATCPFSAPDIAKALASELAGTSPPPPDSSVDITCPDADQAIITVRRGDRPPATRALGLADVEPGLRERVIAVVIAEGLRTAPANDFDAGAWRRVALLGAAHEVDGRVRFAARAQGRAFTDGGALLWGADLAVLAGPLSVGATAATGSHDDVLGSVRPWIIAASAGLSIACWRARAFELCASLRFEAGAALATATPASATVESRSAFAPYLQAGAELGAAFPLGDTALTIDIGGGWSEGVVALADQRTTLRLAGPVVAVSIGARFRP